MTKTATGLDYPATWQDLSAAIDRVAAKRLLFVCGSIKSGTTWTQLWLDRHPEIACRGEGCFFRAYAGALQSLCRNASTTVALQNAHKPALYPEFPAITLPHSTAAAPDGARLPCRLWRYPRDSSCCRENPDHDPGAGCRL